MSRSRTCTRCAELERELAQARADYKDLALAIARRDGYDTAQPVGGPFSATPTKLTFTTHPGAQNYSSADPSAWPEAHALPPNVLAAIEATTEPHSEGRTNAIEAARALLADNRPAEEVEALLREGDDIKV